MEKNEAKQDGTLAKYLSLLSMINEIEHRLGWLGPFFLLLNIILLLFCFFYIPPVSKFDILSIKPLELSFVFFSQGIGMALCTYWSAFATRLQLKLKLRYFQARYLERKMDEEGEKIISDESIFFNPENSGMRSPDGKETLYYPARGFLRMDGFIGSAKPHHFSLFMPSFFFLLYLIIFFWFLFEICC